MLQTLKNAWKIVDLRKKLLFTVMIVIIFRIGSMIPVPYVNSAELVKLFGTDTSIFQYFNILSGEAFSRATLFALSINPYITASIVIQLLTIAIPALERLSKEGEQGRKVITQITRYTTIGLALVTAFGYYTFLKNGLPASILTNQSVFAAFVIVACYTAGSAIIMWLAEKINEKGVGNGISIILLINIISSFPSMIIRVVQNATSKPNFMIQLFFVAGFLALFIAMVIYVVFINNAERRIPVQYAKRQVGRKMYGGQNTNLPLKLTMSGVMPIIFASSIVSLPSTIALIVPKWKDAWLVRTFSSTSPVYLVLFFLLIVAFSYFYLTISFNPVEVSNNLNKNGGGIPGIRPGRPTVEYITKILNKVTLIGAIALGIIAVVPMVLGVVNQAYAGLAFGGSSIIIVVGVIVETAKEIEAQMTMRHYKGFLE